ncbi:hypothetical protein CF326_g6745, partial [Tilletia indica]
MASLLNTLINIRLLSVSGHAVSREDSDDKAKDDLVRQAAARQRTVTPRRHTMRRHGGRLGINKAGRVVTQGTAPQDTPDKRGGPGSGPRSVTRRDDLRLTRQGPKLPCGDGQTDGDESRGLAGQEAVVPRDRADIDSDGKAEDAGRFGLRQERTITARGVKAHSPSTGAARRHPSRRCGSARRRTTRSRRRTAGQWFKTCNRTATAQMVRRGGKTAFSYLVDNANDQCGGTKVRSLRRRLQPVRQDYGSYGSGATRRILTSRAFSQCVNTRILRSQGPGDASSVGSRPAGPRGRHSPTQTVRQCGKTTANDFTVKAKGRSARNQVRDVLETAWVRCIKIRRTTGTAQLLRRGGETTASDFTKAKDRSGRKKVHHPQRQLTLVLQDNAAGRETDDFTGPHPAWVKVSRRRCGELGAPSVQSSRRSATDGWQIQHHEVKRGHSQTKDQDDPDSRNGRWRLGAQDSLPSAG